MRLTSEIEKVARRIRIEPGAAVDARILGRAEAALEKSRATRQVVAGPSFWRIIIKGRISKLAAAAAIILIAVFSTTIRDKSGTPAWGIEQTVEALGGIETAIATGEFTPGASFKFKLWMKRDKDNRNAFHGRVESGEIIGVIRGGMCYNHIQGCGEIYAYDLEQSKGKGIGTKLWYEVMKNAPWIGPIDPTMLGAAKAMASDWQETYGKYGKDEEGRDCVFITGSYEPLSASFWIVFDLETRLIVRLKYWTNVNREGRPALNIEETVYNKEVPDEIFDLEKCTGAKVIDEEETEKRWALWRRALDIDAKKEYAEAIKAFQELYEKYPDFEKTPEALVQIAICYRNMGQHEKAIRFFEKVPLEYSAPRYAIVDAYRLLGRCYMSIGQDTKALEPFQTCLELIEQWDPEGADWQKTRELIEKEIEKIRAKNE